MLEMIRKATKEESDAVPVTPEPCRRTILLSGDRRKPGGYFHLEATIMAAASGGAHGQILWTNVNSPSVPADMACTEMVNGTATGIQLELKGYQIDPPLISESYRIILCGAATAGVFRGMCGLRGVWNVPLAGTYRIVIERG